MNVIISDCPPEQHNRMVKAILEAIEPGAGGHCLSEHSTVDGTKTVWHVRLGVRVTFLVGAA
jgi:hypothetical protein